MKKHRKKKMITASQFDKLFDEGKDVMKYMDPKSIKWVPPVPIEEINIRINIDIPTLMLKKVDQEATRIGIARTALIKMWIAERVDKLAS